jgi:hypothetical protein
MPVGLRAGALKKLKKEKKRKKAYAIARRFKGGSP